MSSVTLRIALRNLRLHLIRTLIVGTLLMMGTCNVVCGTGMLDAVESGMKRSIIGSLAGHAQVYSSEAKDTLELYGSFAQGVPDLGEMRDFSVVKTTLEGMPEVEAVIPMGVERSVVFGTSILDAKLVELRAAVRAGDALEVRAHRDHLRQIVGRMKDAQRRIDLLAADSEEAAAERAALERAASDAFWVEFDAEPLAALEFLDNKIAPLGSGSGMYFLWYVGTDLQAFSKHFDLFEIVEGEMVPPGQKGFLFNLNNYENFIKHKVARRIDNLKRARDEESRRIKTDEKLQRMVERNAEQAGTIVDELSPRDADAVAAVLRAELATDETDISTLVEQFLTMDDATFERRHDLFYEHIGPRIRLHRFQIGETLTLYSQTRSGFLRDINVKIWGTFRFKGLERSTLAGNHHLMDLVTFRELTGLANPVDPAEVARLAKTAGFDDVARDDAEDALFGDDSELIDEDDGATFDEFADADLAGRRRAAEARAAAGYTQSDIDNGPAINAAVILKDGDDIEGGIAALETRIATAGLPLQVLAWKDASGIVGQLTVAMGIVFVFAIVIIFLVALVIINNSLVMSTMDRLREIGTMRAIGAQRSFVVRMFLLEAGLLAIIFGVIGAALGGGLIAITGAIGIPASSDLQFFLFGGKALHPALMPEHILYAVVAIVVTTLLSTFYPALIASRVKPIEAMQAKE